MASPLPRDQATALCHTLAFHGISLILANRAPSIKGLGLGISSIPYRKYLWIQNPHIYESGKAAAPSALRIILFRRGAQLKSISRRQLSFDAEHEVMRGNANVPP